MKYNKEFVWYFYDIMSLWLKWGVKNFSCCVSFIKFVKYVFCCVIDMLIKIFKKFIIILICRNILCVLDCFC